jgi:transaldolase
VYAVLLAAHLSEPAATTKGAKETIYVSPFVGRLDDRGEDGMSLVANIKKTYEGGDGHVHVLAASFRKL